MRRNIFSSSSSSSSIIANSASASLMFVASTTTSSFRNFQAQYGMTIRTHKQMYEKYVVQNSNSEETSVKKYENGEDFAKNILPMLETIEDRLALWKRQKWEFRTPGLLSAEEKAAATALLRKLQSTSETFSEKRRQTLSDSQLVANLTNSNSIEDIRLQPRSWLQKHVSTLRMQGRAQEAKNLRDAWVRMEALGGPDYDLLERLVFVYGLGKMGTFDRTFTNTIKLKPEQAKNADTVDVHEQSGLIDLEQTDPLSTLLSTVLTNVPDIHILYDFLGWNEGMPHTRQNSLNSFNTSYTTSLGEYLSRCLKHQFPEGSVVLPTYAQQSVSSFTKGQQPVLLFADNKNKIYLLRTDENLAQAQTGVAGVSPSFSLWHGPNLTIITKASANKYLRQYQLPNKRQLEGMCRRSAFVFGYELDSVRARTLLLPPAMIDRRSLLRIHSALDPATSIAATPDQSSSTTTNSATQRAAQSEEIILDANIRNGSQFSEKFLKGVPPEFRAWVELYGNSIHVPVEDEDYQVVANVKPEEEWYTL